MADKIVIYTDGACMPNPGKGGWAYYVVGTGEYSSGTVPATTNNRMELTAICKALLALDSKSRVHIKTDSRYCILIAKKESRPEKNPDLWELIRELCQYHAVSFGWVKGHGTDPHNIRVDELANTAAS